MRKLRSFTCGSRKADFSKRAIELQTVYYIDHLGDRGDRRDIAASVCDVTRRTVDAWCSAADPRVISADNLLALATEATARQVALLEDDKIYQVHDNDGHLIGNYRDAGYAIYVADMLRCQASRVDGRPIQLTEEQQLRSRLRRIIATGHIPLKQIAQMVGGDEYVLVDKIVELRNRKERSLFASQIGRIDTIIQRHFDDSWMGEAA
ncbi:hypothetical protein CN140_01800 [Sinorhizobium meliloti]|uniref:hypothetical protein n=1 Tax=Rhizobium meliloti TaxID=382 RepID=UPI000FD9A64F|nr:hypothetical protein [Sinorhizobium meliloti]RVL87691.1 hypothetical protein CN140_01800 [Sinorhizobium meliloti]